MDEGLNSAISSPATAEDAGFKCLDNGCEERWVGPVRWKTRFAEAPLECDFFTLLYYTFSFFLPGLSLSSNFRALYDGKPRERRRC